MVGWVLLDFGEFCGVEIFMVWLVCGVLIWIVLVCLGLVAASFGVALWCVGVLLLLLLAISWCFGLGVFVCWF